MSPKPKKLDTSKKSVAKSNNKKLNQKNVKIPVTFFKKMRIQFNAFLSRRPHRSFKQTMRRDYIRSLSLPGYWAFMIEVQKLLWKHKRIFILTVILYAVLNGTLVGLASQSTYIELGEMLREAGNQVFAGDFSQVNQAVILLGTGILGGINQAPSDAQKIFGPLVALLIWLTTVWILRAILSGHIPKLRDGLYNAGSPIISTFLVSVVLLFQLIPAALAALAIWAASQTGFALNGLEAMLFWAIVILLVILSLYLVTTSFIAMIVVTLPGMYPMQALRTAGDMVIGRRLRILLRLLWLLGSVIVLWLLITVPIILLDTWLKSVWQSIDWIPVVPVTLLIMSAITVVWITTYIYLLYRKIVSDDAKPA